MAGLKDGFTTGSAATAASVAALLASGGTRPESVRIPLPPGTGGRRLDIPVLGCGLLADGLGWAAVRKYAGDDPDVTDGIVIFAHVYARSDCAIEIEGGEGIGVVTLPGLAVPPGQAAINPAPKAQITAALRELAPDKGLRVVLSAPEGRIRAKATMNGKLGIVDGISILGTRGIVKPYSNIAWLSALDQFVRVNQATRQDHVVMATGRRSLELLQGLYAHLPAHAFAVAGDFVADGLARASCFASISWGCFFGKLIKLAQGHGNTHAHTSVLDLAFLAKCTGIAELAEMCTAMQALDCILTHKPGAIMDVVAIAKEWAIKFANKDVTIHLFHADGRELASL